MILLGFAHREVARNHEKSVKIDLFSLNINLRFTMKKKQKSREIAIQESSLGQVKSMKTSSLSFWSGYWQVYCKIVDKFFPRSGLNPSISSTPWFQSHKRVFNKKHCPNREKREIRLFMNKELTDRRREVWSYYYSSKNRLNEQNKGNLPHTGRGARAPTRSTLIWNSAFLT